MTVRAATLAAVGAALLVAASYQRAAVYRISPGTREGEPSVEGFGEAGRSRGVPWRWTTAVSTVCFRDAGQILPSVDRLRVEIGLPRWAQSLPKRVSFVLSGVSLGEVEVVPGFGVHDLPIVITPRTSNGDWVLSLATETTTGPDGTSQGVALVRAELLTSSPPLLPPPRPLLLVVLCVICILALVETRVKERHAVMAATAAAVVAAASLALMRERTVAALPLVAAALVVTVFVALSRRVRLAELLHAHLAAPSASWLAGAMPAVALVGLVLAALRVGPVAAFALSVVATAVWLALVESVRASGPEVASGQRRYVPVVLGITLLALFLRLYHLEDLPFAIFRDEARHGLLALRLLGDPSYRPLFLGPPINQPLPYFLAVAGAIRIFGTNLFALRVVSAVAGAAVAPLLYGLVRAVVGPREAAIASLLLATSSWHLSISRFAVNYVEPSLFSLPAYWLLWRALPKARPGGLCLAALLVGLGQYSAHTAKALFIVAAGLVIDEVAQRLVARDRAGMGKLVLAVAAAAVVGLLTIVPILRFVRQDPNSYFARAQQVSLWSQRDSHESAASMLFHSVETYARAFHLYGDPNGRHHLPGAPLLDPVAGLGLLAGLGLALAGPASRSHRFLLLWLLAGLLPGLVTVDAPSALRTVEAAPAAYAIAALGVVSIWDHRPRAPSRGWGAIAAGVLAIAVAWNVWTYFVRMRDSPAVWRRFAPIATHLGKRLQELRKAGSLPGRTTLYMPRGFIEDPDTRFVIGFYWPTGLHLKTLDDAPTVPPSSAAVVLPNQRDFWLLTAEVQPSFSGNAKQAGADQEAWAAAIARLGRQPPIAGPPFPATDKPTFWLYLPE